MARLKCFKLLVLILCVNLCSSEIFLPYGLSAGDRSLNLDDDTTREIRLTKTIKIGNQDFASLYVSDNGAVFGSPFTNINPRIDWRFLPDVSILPYFADAIGVRTCSECKIYVRNSYSAQDLLTTNRLINRHDPTFNADVDRVLVVTWYRNKGYYSNQANTFQVIIASNGRVTYGIASYETLNYYGSSSPNRAKIGYKTSSGYSCDFPSNDGNPMSLTCLSNVGRPGVIAFGLTPDAVLRCGVGQSANLLSAGCYRCGSTVPPNWITPCSNTYRPVCGSNGVTYPNECKFFKSACENNNGVVMTNRGVCAAGPQASSRMPPVMSSYMPPVMSSYKQPAMSTDMRPPMSSYQVMSSHRKMSSRHMMSSYKVHPTRSLHPSMTRKPMSSRPAYSSKRIHSSAIRPSSSMHVQPSTSYRPPSPPTVPIIRCNFESGACGATGNWSIFRPIDQRRFPGVDNTTGTPYGHYLYHSSLISRVSVLTTPLIAFQPNCQYLHVRLARFMNASGTIIMSVHAPFSSRRIATSYISGSTFNRWSTYNVYISIPSLERYIQLSFTGVSGVPGASDISIDDVFMEMFACSGQVTTRQPTTTFNVTTRPPNPNIPIIRCHFENGTCGATGNWSLVRPFGRSMRPPVDNTTGTPYGHYLYHSSLISRVSVLTTPLIAFQPNCQYLHVRLARFMNASGTIIMSVHAPYSSRRIATSYISGSTFNRWSTYNVYITIPSLERYIQLSFTGVSGVPGASDISIDDVFMEMFACSGQVTTRQPTTTFNVTTRPPNPNIPIIRCHFENGTCGATGNWSLVRPFGRSMRPPVDNTTGTPYGYYLHHSSLSGRVSVQTTPVVVFQSYCRYLHVRLARFMDVTGTLLLFVHRAYSPQEIGSYYISGSTFNRWSTSSARITIPSWERFIQLSFVGVTGQRGTSDISIDDVVMVMTGCSGQVNTTTLRPTTTPRPINPNVPITMCNFENGTCGSTGNWSLVRPVDNRAQQMLPPVDNTTGFPFGHYLHHSSLRGLRSVQTTPVIAFNPNCQSLHVRLARFMNASGYLIIFVHAPYSSREIRSSYIFGSTFNRWSTSNVFISIPLQERYIQVSFVGVSGQPGSSDISIDDLLMEMTGCSGPTSTTPGPTTPPTPPKPKSFYPFGREHNDTLARGGDDIVFPVYLKNSMPLFTKLGNRILISTNGHIHINNTYSGFNRAIPTNDTFLSIYQTDLDTRNNGGSIYYRETENNKVLERATEDVRKLMLRQGGFYPFRAKSAVIVTYFEVHAYSAPNRNRNTFQAVLATDGVSTYAILHYARLNSTNAITGYSEGRCNYKIFAPRPQSQQLARTSNIGENGRHVYLLSNHSCHARAIDTGVRFYSQLIWLDTPFGVSSFYVSLLKTGEIAKLAAGGLELSSSMGKAFSFLNIIGPLRNSTYVSISYGTRVAHHIAAFLQGFMVIDGTPKNSNFQYGNITVPIHSSATSCRAVIFPRPMMSKPAIKLTGDLMGQGHNFLRHADIWLRDVSMEGFQLCAKEAISFSPVHNLSIHYVAVAGAGGNFTEYGSVMFVKGQDKHCKSISLKYIYMKPPYVFITPEEADLDNGALTSFVKRINQSSVEICAATTKDTMMSRNKNINVNYIIKGDISPCSSYMCSDHLQCHLGRNRQPFCGCIKTCNSTKDSVICGSDFVTYESDCDIHRRHCMKHGNRTRSMVTGAHRGKCERHPYQSGIAQLDTVPGIPAAFCKYITVDSLNFHPSLNISVQLSVSWGQKNATDIAHDAAASWSEDVTRNGFKACVLVAGRHYFSTIKQKPYVHWYAYQLGVVHKSHGVAAGVIDISTWYTGSKCYTLPNWITRDGWKTVVSVEHTKPRSFQNAMTAWVETYKDTDYQVCLRELQNFDGKHEGLRLHWFSMKGAETPYFSEVHELVFRASYIPYGQRVPAMCQQVRYNNGMPSLDNPTVLITAVVNADRVLFPSPIPYENGTTKSVMSSFSMNDITVWLEHTSRKHMVLCYKSIRSSNYRAAVKISYMLLPDLCGKGWTYISGHCARKLQSNCYNQTMAMMKCAMYNATLPMIPNDGFDYFVRQNTKENKTWIGLKNTANGSYWLNMKNSSKLMQYRNWAAGQPTRGANEQCTVSGGVKTPGWDDVPCSRCSDALCMRPARLVERSCEGYCVNGGSCYQAHMNNTGPMPPYGGNRTNGTIPTPYPGRNGTRNNTGGMNMLQCRCLQGYAGVRCEIDTSNITECSNFTTHEQPWRSPMTTIMQPNYTSCDPAMLRHGWHRFIGMGGSKLADFCPGSHTRCGTRSPGWINGTHPTFYDGVVKRNLQFYSHYCADDHGEVYVRNCGGFYTYRFGKMPYWSCNFGMCTSD